MRRDAQWNDKNRTDSCMQQGLLKGPKSGVSVGMSRGIRKTIQNALSRTPAAEQRRPLPKNYFENSGMLKIIAVEEMILGRLGLILEPGRSQEVSGGFKEEEPRAGQRGASESQEAARREPGDSQRDNLKTKISSNPFWGHHGPSRGPSRCEKTTAEKLGGNVFCCLGIALHNAGNPRFGSVRFGFRIDWSGSCGSVAGRFWLQQGNGEARGTWGN